VYASDEDSGDSSSCDISSTASSVATDSDSEDGGKSPTAAGCRPDRGSVLCKQFSLGEPRKVLYEFVEHAAPHMREPLTDRIQQLAEGNGDQSFPGLLTLRSCDIHPASWFAITWYPIYRIPNGRAVKDLQASFLTYHSFAMPASHCPDYDLLESKPTPPTPPPAAADAYEKRRQSASARMGKEVIFLQPFAFMPYKMIGRTWWDAENEAAIHAPMRAAAGAWVQRRRLMHSDLEFFSQRSGQQQLPSNLYRR
jgi:hypothetical protein